MEISDAEILEKNRIYDNAADAVWKITVYEPVHDGWEFTNMGGREVLDFIGQYARLNSATKAVEFCSGLGATCRYLALNFGCHVTGIELNGHQIAHARANLARCDPQISARISFEQSNILDWQPSELYDLAYTIDSLTLVKDSGKVLDKAREVLKPAGRIVLAEMTAGPQITDKHRRFAWEVDGMINLPTPEQYADQLKSAGFTSIEVADITDLAEDCFNKIYEASEREKQALIDAAGEKGQQSWTQIADLYRQCFRERRFCYSRISARRG